MVPHLLDLIPWTSWWEFMVVPQHKDVIPRKYRGGSSCKGVISRRPRGDASLLGRNSTTWWWCVILRIQIVKSWSLKWFGNLWVNVCYLCPTVKLHVDCYDVRFLYTSLPFRLLVCCVWFSLLRWSSISLMWADVRISSSGNEGRDTAAWWILDGNRAHFGAHSFWSFSSLSFSLMRLYILL